MCCCKSKMLLIMYRRMCKRYFYAHALPVFEQQLPAWLPPFWMPIAWRLWRIRGKHET
jgi:hypothetical protein